MKTIQDLKNNPSEVFEFTDGAHKYIRSKDALSQFNKVTGFGVKYVFVNAPYNTDNKDKFHFESGITFVVTKSNKVLQFNNSEWASIQGVG